MSKKQSDRMAEVGATEEKGFMTETAQQAENNDDLLQKVGERMATVFEDKPEDYAPAEEETTTKASETATETTETTTETEQAAVEIPHNLVRSAIHNGWSQEDIDAFVERDPDAALRTLENIYNSDRTLSAQFANLGRAQQQMQQQQTEQPAPQTKTPEIDLSEIKERYGDDPIVQVIEALVKQNTAAPAIAPQPKPSPQVREFYDPAVATGRENANKMIDDFFVTDGIQKSYEEFYGKGNDYDHLTISQTRNRQAVLETADQILAGVAVQGKHMPVYDALEKAHMLVSEPVRASAIRDEIRKNTVQRGKSLTLKPSASQSETAKMDQRPKTQDDLIKKVDERLRNINW